MRLHAAWATLLFISLSILNVRAAESESYALQGYGRISLEIAGGDSPAVFRCEDDASADRLLSKLLADFSWDRLTGPQRQTLTDGVSALKLQLRSTEFVPSHSRTIADGVSALKSQPRELLLFARQGRTVYALCGDSAEAIERQRVKLGLDLQHARIQGRAAPSHVAGFLRSARGEHVLLAAERARPGRRTCTATMPGRWGKRAPSGTPSGYGHSFFGPYFGLDELADGAGHFFPHEWMIRQAVADDAIVMSHVGQYGAPWWMRNRFPRDIVQWDPYAISGWNALEAMAGTHLSQHAARRGLCLCASGSPGRPSTRSRPRRATTWAASARLAGGHPGDELALHHASTEFMDYDEAGQKAFRRWLREARGLDLAALGRRWFDDPGRYRSWDEVTLPSHFEFFGGFGDGSLNLLSGLAVAARRPAGRSRRAGTGPTTARTTRGRPPTWPLR